MRPLSHLKDIFPVAFFVNFGPDIHDMDENLPTGNEQIEENDDSNRSLIFVLLIFSIIGILLIIPQLIKSNE